MSELEIKELQLLQEKITRLEKEIKTMNSSNIYKLKFFGHSEYDELKLNMIPGLEKRLVDFLIKEYSFHLDNYKTNRDILILCEKQTKSVYKPIDILDKE